MKLEQVEDDGSYGEIRFKTIIKDCLQFIHITMEAWEDILRGELNDNNKERVVKIIAGKLSAKQFVERPDKVGVPYQAVLIKTEDLA
jgi:hypothetical protein